MSLIDYYFVGTLSEYLTKLGPVWGELHTTEKDGTVTVFTNGGPIAIFSVDHSDTTSKYGVGKLWL